MGYTHMQSFQRNYLTRGPVGVLALNQSITSPSSSVKTKKGEDRRTEGKEGERLSKNK